MSQNLVSTSGISATFIILTTIFFGFKAYKSNNVNQEPFSLAWTIMYIIIIMLLEFFNNLSVASQICSGSSQNTFSVFMYTLIPNFLILGSVITIISALPGWLSPFSNTIGYFIVSCMGLSRNFNSLLKSAKGSGAQALITKICSDKSLVINEMTPDNYTEFMQTLSNIFVKKYNTLPEYNNLYALVVIKTLISEYIWYLLAGLLAISVSSHALSKLQCEYSPEEMKKNIAELHEEEQEMESEKANNQPVLYTKNN